MKKLILLIVVGLMAQFVSAKSFDSVFNEFKKVENADYVKIPGMIVRLGMSSISKKDKMGQLPLDIKLTGMRVLSLEEASAAKRAEFVKAVESASASCELMLEANDEGDEVSIWVEPKNAKSYSKMIIFSKNDAALVEFSGKFTPKK